MNSFDLYSFESIPSIHEKRSFAIETNLEIFITKREQDSNVTDIPLHLKITHVVLGIKCDFLPSEPLTNTKGTFLFLKVFTSV